ncbi:hypothetical protein Vadar_033830 [Vaccinium darrowii]|uniref:Uncharacterized protein n=1 Tax=Vaccinium darrowii TaxID=229202 RepID=A0ACB7X6D2_9ERIC|nr:hypothetical protein Vadar_033830 [Vaccinium darrowii]
MLTRVEGERPLKMEELQAFGSPLLMPIFIWDWRTKKQIACSEESHMDDVTQVINVGTSVRKVGFFGESSLKLWHLTRIEILRSQHMSIMFKEECLPELSERPFTSNWWDKQWHLGLLPCELKRKRSNWISRSCWSHRNCSEHVAIVRPAWVVCLPVADEVSLDGQVSRMVVYVVGCQIKNHLMLIVVLGFRANWS